MGLTFAFASDIGGAIGVDLGTGIDRDLYIDSYTRVPTGKCVNNQT